MYARDDAPLLPTLRDEPRLDQLLRCSLHALRDQASDPGLRERIDLVLVGKASLRDLARDPEFGAFITPYADQAWQEWHGLDPEERERLRQPPPDTERMGPF